MVLNKQDFIQRYTQLVHDYVSSPDEKYLAEIEYLGQEMVLAKLPPEEIGEMHDLAIAHLIETSELGIKHIRVVSLPLMQLLMAYGISFRSLLAKKQAEESLHLASRAIATTVEGIIITDGKGLIVDVNNAFERVTGYAKSEAIGQNPSMLHSGKQEEQFYKELWQCIDESGRWQGEIWNKRKNGEIYPEHLSITAIHDDQGNITNYIGVFSDISEQISLQAQLQQAQKMEAIGTLVGGIAHDFNNMLAGMTGNLYLAKKNIQAQPSVMQKLENIEKLSFRAADMIQQLLTFSRKGIVDMQKMPLTPFIKETLKFIRTSVPENIVLNLDICSEALLIKGDATQLHQVLMNLVNNARDAVEDANKPEIMIKLERFEVDETLVKCRPDFSEGVYAHLSVSDNGCGIEKDQIEHLFEPFYTTKEVGKGTGLGLAMVYGAMKTHQGMVEADSQEGVGSTFHIYIPLQTEQRKVTEVPQQHGSNKGFGEFILLVDDEVIVRETVAEVLESMGYKVLQAKDGLQALDVFKAHQQDIAIALLDVVMPVCGGVTLANNIREINAELPVIFLTGYDKEHVLNGNAQLPLSQVMVKPVAFDDLADAIRKFLD